MPSRRLPRDLDAERLVRALSRLGYVFVRQSGSHIRVKTERHGEHSITIPCHHPIKVGTLSAILSEIASHHELERDALLDELGL